MTGKEAIYNFLDQIRKAIIAEQIRLDIRTTGHSAESLEIYTRPSGGDLVGDKYIGAQVDGRKPGKFPPPEDILSWIKRKGIQPRNPKQTQEDLVYPFSRKIAMQGTDIFMRKRAGIGLNAIIEKLRPAFTRELAGVKRIEYSSSIKTLLQNAGKQLP